MQSHKDDDRATEMAFMQALRERAKKMHDAGESVIAGGRPGEPELASWEWKGVLVTQRPDDPQGILRISIGGGEGLPITANYCVFRGDRESCITLLRKALDALRKGSKIVNAQDN